jgi:regulator of replication initiation timing
MEIEIKQEDIQSVIQANPMVALQFENQALRRKLSETANAFDGAMSENKRLAEELAKSKNGKSPKEK